MATPHYLPKKRGSLKNTPISFFRVPLILAVSHNFDMGKICAYIFNSHRICAQGLYSNLLDYFWMKDPLGCWRTHWGVWFNWKVFWWWFQPTMKSWWCMAHWGRGSLLGIFWWYVVHWGTSFHWENDYLLLSHKSLRIDVDSTLKGALPNSTGEILFCNSWGSYFCALDPWGSPSMILDCLGIYLIILTHGGVFMMIPSPLRDVSCLWSTEDISDGSNLLGNDLDALDSLGCLWCMLIH